MADGTSFTELSVDRLATEAGMRAAMAAIIASYRRHQPLLVALGELAAYDPVVGAAYREQLAGISARLCEVIEDGQTDGSIRRELPAATTAGALTWMVERACQQSLPGAPPAHDAELSNALTQIVYGALYLTPLTR